MEVVQGISQDQREMKILCEDLADFDVQLDKLRDSRIRTERAIEVLFILIENTEKAIKELERKGIKRVAVSLNAKISQEQAGFGVPKHSAAWEGNEDL